MAEYRWAEEADYGNIISFANRAFCPDEWTGDFEHDTADFSYFPRILPKLYRNIKTAPMHLLAVKGEEIVGLVGNFPLEMKAGDETLSVMGIGTVSTHPDHRGEGHMKKLMAMSVENAKERGIDFMVLGGQRQRYEHWGFEQAGVNTVFHFNRGNTRRLFGKDADFGYRARPLLPEDRDFIKKERLLRTSALTSVYHDREEEYDILFSMGGAPYVILKNGSFIGTYIQYEDRISDLRIFDPREVLHVVNDLLLEKESLNIDHIAPFDKLMTRLLAETCDGADIGCCEMIKILNYERTIRTYLKMASKCRNLSDGDVRLAFPNGERLHIYVKSGVPGVEPVFGTDMMSLEEKQAVNLLFGAYGAVTDYGTNLPGEIYAWFPLPFFIYMSDEV